VTKIMVALASGEAAIAPHDVAATRGPH